MLSHPSNPLTPHHMMETPTKSLKHPWICILTYLTLFLCLSPYKAEAKHKSLYTKHCSSVVHEANPDPYSVATIPFANYHQGYYNGGGNIVKSYSLPSSMHSNAFTFEPQEISKTDHEGVVKVEAYLWLRITDYDNYGNTTYYLGHSIAKNSSSRHRSSISFRLEGFWSKSSGKLCMVGSTIQDQGDPLDLRGVLKMNDVWSSANISTVFTGTLESLIPVGEKNYFDKVSLMMFPRSKYNYGLVSEGGFGNGGDLPQGLPPPDGRFCSTFREDIVLTLKYEASCVLAKNCTPFVGVPGFLPTSMSLRKIGCLESDKKLHVLLRFSNSTYVDRYGSLDPRTALVGEGVWEANNLMHLVACPIMTRTGSFDTAYVGDCSINLVLLFPAIWSIKERNIVVGRIWSKKEVNDSGYFPVIQFKTSSMGSLLLPNLKYRYTKTESINKLCPKPKQDKSDGDKYPDSNSYDLGFRMLFKNSRGKIASGYATPLFVGKKLYQNGAYGYVASDSNTFFPGYEIGSSVNSQLNSNADGQFNISYNIQLYHEAESDIGKNIFNRADSTRQLEISAEGVYHEGTGYLCLVGCSDINSTGSTDCNISINLQFPPMNSKKQPVISGSIRSTRTTSDPLHFETLNFTSMAYYTEISSQTMWRLDLELTLVLISNTLSCILVGIQLLYVRKHPEVLPFTSLFMLVIVTLGYMFPLVLNFEAFVPDGRNRKDVFLESGKLLEVNEVVVRLATMVAFLLQSRLLQLTWLARKSEGNRRESWKAEKKALVLALPLYVIGALAALLIYGGRNNLNNEVTLSSSSIVLKRYAGFVLDGFLVPQILLNMFRNSKEKVLSNAFYVGTTLVRLVPHGYDLYRSHNTFVPQHDATYFYGNPGGDYYSTSWDVIIPLGGLVFAAIIYSQQRFGGRCILPRRFRGYSFAYDKVAVVDKVEGI